MLDRDLAVLEAMRQGVCTFDGLLMALPPADRVNFDRAREVLSSCLTRLRVKKKAEHVADVGWRFLRNAV